MRVKKKSSRKKVGSKSSSKKTVVGKSGATSAAFKVSPEVRYRRDAQRMERALLAKIRKIRDDLDANNAAVTLKYNNKRKKDEARGLAKRKAKARMK